MENKNWENAAFADLESSPSSMEAGRLVDIFGLRPDYDIQQSDAAQAYLQAKIRGKPTWVLLPRDQWLASWSSMRKPFCRLNVALCGHPDSGTDWEHHCDQSLQKVSFRNVGEGAWPSCYCHKDLELLISVYVDDFKLAGPKTNIEKGWTLLSQFNELDPHNP